VSKKKESREKRALRARKRIKDIGGYRLSVFRSLIHTYAQVIAVSGGDVVASAFSGEKSIQDLVASGELGDKVSKSGFAGMVGKVVAERALSKGVSSVSFDRSGYKYHGRVKALADGARAAGLSF
jgi:large subunit ribosomal protein L18